MQNQSIKYMCFNCKKEDCEYRNALNKSNFENGTATYCNHGFEKRGNINER